MDPTDPPPETYTSGQMELGRINVAQGADLLIEKLHETGVIYSMRRFVSNRLTRYGWNANLRHAVVDYVKQNGPNNVNVSHMWSDLAEVGLQTTPTQVKEEIQKYLDQFGQTYIEVDGTIQVTPPEPDDGEKMYQIQSREAVPEPPSGLYPPLSPEGHPKYVRPPWLFVYDKPKPPNEAASESGESYDSTSPSSSATPPEVDERDDEEDVPSPGSLDSRGEVTASRKHNRPEQQQQKERKKRLEKARQRDRQQMERGGAVNSSRVLKTGDKSKGAAAAASAATASASAAGQKLNSGLISPQLSAPLRQLKIDKKSAQSAGGVESQSKLPQQLHPPPATTTHHHKIKGEARRGAAATAAKNELVEEEEEEELMDV